MVFPRISEPRLGDEPKVDYRGLAVKRFAEWGELFGRMRIDADMINMVSTTTRLLDADDHEIPHSVHVLLNDIAGFAWRVETALNSAVEQIDVTSKNKRFDTAYVENFLKAYFSEADKLLAAKRMFPFNPFIDQQSFRRGRVACFCNAHFEGKVFIPTLTPWDTRYVVLENDNKGIVWTGTKFYRPESVVISEYPLASGHTTSGIDNEILYILSRNTSEVWVGTKEVQTLLKTLDNKLGYVPVVYREVPMGSMLGDKDAIKFQGESGIFLIRDMFVELERIASAIMTINLKVIDQSLQIQKPATESVGNATPGKTVDELTAPGSVNETPEGGRGYELMPLGQLQAMFDRLLQMIESRMQKAMASRFPDLPQPRTATEIMLDAQEQGNIISPRLAARGLLKQDLSYMLIKQTIAVAEKAKVQTVELDGEDWEISQLKEDYKIEFKYHFEDPRMDAARQSLATAQRGLIPDRDIRINTLQREDWEADERQLRWEEDERLSPLVKLDRNIRGLLEDAKRGEPGAERQAKMLIIQMIPALRQAMEGLMTPNMPEELKPAQPIVPLLTQGNQGGQQNV